VVEIPDFIEVIQDVTGDRKYKNFSMTKHFPLELAYLIKERTLSSLLYLWYFLPARMVNER
jgi:hypothetical protein